MEYFKERMPRSPLAPNDKERQRRKENEGGRSDRWEALGSMAPGDLLYISGIVEWYRGKCPSSSTKFQMKLRATDNFLVVWSRLTHLWNSQNGWGQILLSA